MAKKARVQLTPQAAEKAPEPEPLISATAMADEQVITVYDELLDVCRSLVDGFKPQGKGENDQQYFARMMSAISTIPQPEEGEEDEFEKLPIGVKDWYNESGTLLNAGKPAEAPAGFVSGASAAKAANGKAPKEAKVKAEKAPPKPKEPRGPATGPTSQIRRIVLRNPTGDLASVKAELDKMGLVITPSTISTIRSDVLATYAIAQELNLLAA